MTSRRQDVVVVHVVLNATVGAVLLFLGWRALRPVSWKELLRFGVEQDVELDAESAPVVMRALAAQRCSRMTGALLGAGVAMTATATSLRLPGTSTTIGTWVGYFGGALVGALRAPEFDRSGPRMALLVPRRVTDYVSRQDLRWAGLMLAAGLAAAAVGVLGPRRQQGWEPGPIQIAVPAALAVVVAVVCSLTIRRVVDRAQPLATPSITAADDALRASSLAITTGAGLAMIAVLCSSVAFNAGSMSDIQVVRWVSPWLGVAMMFVAYGSWFGFRRMGRRVRRVAT